MRRVLGRLVLIILIVPIVLLGAVLAMISTETGTSWLIHQGATFAPGQAQVGSVEGTLTGALKLADLHYSLDSHQVQLEEFVLRWEPEALLRGVVHVQELLANGVRYSGPPPQPAAQDQTPEAPLELPEIRLPVAVRLDQLRVQQVEIRQGERRQTLDELHLAAVFDDAGLRIEKLYAKAPQGQVNVQGQAQTIPPYPFQLSLNWSTELIGGTETKGQGQFRGDLNEIHIEHATRGPIVLDIHGAVALADATIDADLSGNWQNLRWPLTGTAEFTSPSGQFSLQGGPEEYQLSLNTELGGTQLPTLEATIKARGNTERAVIERLNVATLDGQLAVSGEVSWRPNIHWALKLSGENLNPGIQLPEWTGNLGFAAHTEGSWSPDSLQARLTLSELEGQLQGQPVAGALEVFLDTPKGSHSPASTYGVELQGRLLALGLPEIRPQIQGTLTPQAVQLQPARVETLGGALIAAGNVSWAPQPQWSLTLQAININPGVHWTDFPGKLSLNSQVEGQIQDGVPRVAVELKRLDGRFRGYPVFGKGHIKLTGTEIHTPGLAVGSGDNQVRLEGRVGEVMDLAFQLDAPRLDELWPGLSGRAEGQGQIRGALKNPAVEARVDAEQIGFQNFSLQRLDLDVKLDPKSARESRTTLIAENIAAASQSVSVVELNGFGNLDTHRLTVLVDSTLGELRTELAGGLKTELWRGQLRSTSIRFPPAGIWSQSVPTDLVLGSNQADLDTFCLAQDSAAVCAKGSWNPSDGVQAVATVQELPFSIAKEFLPPELDLEGELNARATVDTTPGGIIAHLEAIPSPGSFAYRTPEGETLRATYGNARISADYVDDALDLNLGMAVAEDGKVEGRIQVGPASAESARPLNGYVEARFPNLALLSGFVPTVQILKGSFSLAADLGGTVAAPDIQGEATIADAAAQIDDIGLKLTDIGVRAKTQGAERIALAGEVTSGEGTLNLNGTVLLKPEEGWPVDLRIEGERFQVVQLPEAQAVASPDLSIALRGGKTNVTGKIIVPSALVELQELPKGAVTVSEDEVIITDSESSEESEEKAPQGAASKPVAVNSRIELVLGDDVRFEGFGLKTRLTGSIEVTSRTGRAPLAQGMLALKEGRYKAYGQDLTIQRGRFLFGGPIDNPTLDVRAVRKVDDIIAGLILEGTAKAPQTRLFSEPPMNEGNILSYILTGAPLGAGGDSKMDKEALMDAVAAFGLNRSGSFTQQIGESVGLDTLTVQGGETLEESSLLFGKYLTPDLYVGYALGLFDRQGAVELKYKLTKHLRLRTTSGTQQSMELLYTIETD